MDPIGHREPTLPLQGNSTISNVTFAITLKTLLNPPPQIVLLILTCASYFIVVITYMPLWSVICPGMQVIKCGSRAPIRPQLMTGDRPSISEIRQRLRSTHN